MKLLHKKILSFLLALSIVLLSIFACPLSVYATSSGVHPDPDKPLGNILVEGAKHAVMYIISQIGAVTDGNFFNYMQNKATWDDYWNGDNIKEVTDDSGNVVSYTFSEELMAYIKQCLDDYAAENQGFFVKGTHKANQIPASTFAYKEVYKAFIDYSKSHYMFFFKLNGNGFNVYDFTPEFKEGGGFYNAFNYQPAFCTKVLSVDSDWNTWDSKAPYYDYYEFKKNDAGDMVLDTVHEKFSYLATRYSGLDITFGRTDFNPSYSNVYFLVTQDGGNIRVYKSVSDLINYSVGQRKIFYTSNYYDYVPDDLSVSIDDLQKTIEDMQDVIDKLLEQIGNDTSESEIEELLRLILEELKNNQGSGGGGGGDVNVDIDLSSTNSLLSKILAKVTQIFDKMSGGTDGTGGGILQESLDAVLARLDDLNAMLKKYLSEITGDLDDIKGQLANMSEQEFEQKSDSFLGEVMDAFSEISEVVKTKFPFSIPNDLRIFLSKIAPAQSEAEAALYLDDMSGMVLYSGEHGGNGTTDGETNPPGGGGASRPGGSGFVSVDHGGGGGSREPAEMREAPVFRLPIVIESYGIEEYIIIDMAPFDPLSRFSRSFFTIIFMVCLFNLTFKVIGMWGDIIG